MHATYINQKDIKLIETIVYEFIWRGRDKIKRETLKLPFESGGLCSPDIQLIYKTVKLKMFMKLSHLWVNHPVKVSWKRNLLNNGLVSLNETNTTTLNNFLNSKTAVMACINSSCTYNLCWTEKMKELVESNSPVDIKYKVTLAKTPLITISDNNNIRQMAKRLSIMNINTIFDLLTCDINNCRFSLKN